VLESALTAVIVTALEGAVEGGVYRPVEEMVPVVELPPLTPFTNQVTDWFVDPRPGALTAAEYCAVCPMVIVEGPDTVTARLEIGSVHEEGQLLRVGWNGGEGGTSPKIAQVFSAGLLTMFSTAPMVSVGAVPPVGLVSLKSAPQFVLSPADPPVELTHEEIASAKVVISKLDA